MVVVLAAENYPQSPRKGDAISGLEAAATVDGTQVFHAGTAERDGAIVTAGGRVLGVGAIGSSAGEARSRAYTAVAHISWQGMHYRRDIATSAE